MIGVFSREEESEARRQKAEGKGEGPEKSVRDGERRGQSTKWVFMTMQGNSNAHKSSLVSHDTLQSGTILIAV